MSVEVGITSMSDKKQWIGCRGRLCASVAESIEEKSGADSVAEREREQQY